MTNYASFILDASLSPLEKLKPFPSYKMTFATLVQLIRINFKHPL